MFSFQRSISEATTILLCTMWIARARIGVASGLGSLVTPSLFVRQLAKTKPTFLSKSTLFPIFNRNLSSDVKQVDLKKDPIAEARSLFTAEELEASRLARLEGLGSLKRFPEKWIPYMELMRMEKPAGTLLLLSPCTWSITMAAYMTSAPLLSTIWMLSVFTVGAFVMRGAGCTVNDMWDRNLDNKVARTIERPITSGRVSMPQAWTFLGAQLAVGLVILLQLPLDCFLLGASSLVLVGTYPFFKRITYYPQVVLSACFTWGALLGFPAMGVWNWPVMIPLYLSGFFWCMTYDTVYAHQDKTFDIKAGIKSTALAWGANSKKICYAMSAAQMGCFVTSGFLAGMGPFFYLGAAAGGFRLFNMIRKVNLDNPTDCWKFFKSNINTGHIFWLGILLDYLCKIFM